MEEVRTENDKEFFLFTSESVGEGHSDKLCDQVSDAILDAHLKQDPDAKVACETIVKTGVIIICGEITSKGIVDYQQIVRDTIKQIGKNESEPVNLYLWTVTSDDEADISFDFPFRF